MYVAGGRTRKTWAGIEAGLSASHCQDHMPIAGSSWEPENTVLSSPEPPSLSLKGVVPMILEVADCIPTLEALRDLQTLPYLWPWRTSQYAPSVFGSNVGMVLFSLSLGHDWGRGRTISDISNRRPQIRMIHLVEFSWFSHSGPRAHYDFCEPPSTFGSMSSFFYTFFLN